MDNTLLLKEKAAPVFNLNGIWSKSRYGFLFTIYDRRRKRFDKAAEKRESG